MDSHAKTAMARPRTNDPASGEVHVSSLLVRLRPERADAVAKAIGRIPGAEVAGQEGGKLVLTLTSGGEKTILAAIDHITALPGVFSAELVYHAIDADEEASP